MFKVIVKDGRTQNLVTNFIAINGDLEDLMSRVSTPVLADGEYDANGFDAVLQIDDSKNVWVMAPDAQHAIRMGWPTRRTLYFFTDNLSTPDIKTCYIKTAVSQEELPASQQKFIVDLETLHTIFVAAFNYGVNEGPFPTHGTFDAFKALIAGKPLPGPVKVSYDIADKIKPYNS